MKKITRIIPLFVKDNMSSFSHARYEKGFTKDMLADAAGISIDAVRKDTLEAELYDLNGRLVGRMPLGKGFYVRSGKKVIVK